MNSPIVTVSLALTLFASDTHAGARDQEDVIFDDPRGNGLVGQAVLGYAEYTAAQKLFAANRGISAEVRNAEASLASAKDLYTEAERAAEIAQLEADARGILAKNGAATVDDLPDGWFNDAKGDYRLVQGEIEALRGKAFVPEIEKNLRIGFAQVELANARKAAIEAAAKQGLWRTGLKAVRAVGGTVLIVDVLGRVYVWTALERDPTFSPVAAVSLHALGLDSTASTGEGTQDVAKQETGRSATAAAGEPAERTEESPASDSPR